MTWVMEEDTQSPVRENQGWRGGGNELFMRQNYAAFTFLNKLNQNPSFLTFSSIHRNGDSKSLILLLVSFSNFLLPWASPKNFW